MKTEAEIGQGVHRCLEKPWDRPSLMASDGASPADTLVLDFRSLELPEDTFLLCVTLLQQPWGTHTHRSVLAWSDAWGGAGGKKPQSGSAMGMCQCLPSWSLSFLFRKGSFLFKI